MKLRGRILIALVLGLFLSVLAVPVVTMSSARTAALFNDSEIQQQPQPTDTASAQIYQQRCASCHENPVDRIPPRFLIARRSAEDVIQTLTTGAMKQQAAGLTAEQIRALAIFLTGKQPGSGSTVDLNANPCKDPGGPINLKGPQWNGWGRDLDNSRFQP